MPRLHRKLVKTCHQIKKKKGNSNPLVAQLVKNLPAMQETWFQSLGWEDSPEKEMATHSCLENPMDRGAW